MSKPIQLFVSSSPDLQAEREVVGQVVATLPRDASRWTIGWRIGHTPVPGQPASGEIVPVEECDLYVLILGHDFAAPMGFELRQALARGIEPLAFRKKCTNSPSAQDAIRRLDVEWRVVDSSSQLRRLFTQDLLQTLVHQATRLGLNMKDLESLLELSVQASDESKELASRPSDAGQSGVILGREVWG